MTPAEKYFQRANGGKPSEDSEMITAKWATILMTDFAEQENKELMEEIQRLKDENWICVECGMNECEC